MGAIVGLFPEQCIEGAKNKENSNKSVFDLRTQAPIEDKRQKPDSQFY